ncbi:MAG: hypothetical protein GY851_26030 [bacterium]|nr:hypothetical protein [bacterium]
MAAGDHTYCEKCKRPIDEADSFCKHCGAHQTRRELWYQSPIAILVLAFTVLGPLAIPLVWRSPQMGTKAKTWCTVAIGLYFAFVLWLGYVLLRLIFHTIYEINGLNM